MPDSTVVKDKQFTFECHDTVHVVEFCQLEFLADLLAIGTTTRLIIVRCTAKVLPAPAIMTVWYHCCAQFVNSQNALHDFEITHALIFSISVSSSLWFEIRVSELP